jgi:hypothetical protein
MSDDKVDELTKQLAVNEAVYQERWQTLVDTLSRVDSHLKRNEKAIIELSKTMETSKGALKALGLISAVLGIFILAKKLFGV